MHSVPTTKLEFLNALQRDDVKTVKRCLDEGQKMDEIIDQDQTPLKIAFQARSINCTVELIKRGADINDLEYRYREIYQRIALGSHSALEKASTVNAHVRASILARSLQGASCAAITSTGMSQEYAVATSEASSTTKASGSTATDYASCTATYDDSTAKESSFTANYDDSVANESSLTATYDDSITHGTGSIATGKRGWFRRLKEKLCRSKTGKKTKAEADADSEVVRFNDIIETNTRELIKALENEDVETVQCFLDEDQEVDEKIRGNETLLMIAAKAGSIGCVVEIIKRGANIHNLDSSYLSDLLQISAMDHNRSLSEALLVHWRISEDGIKRLLARTSVRSSVSSQAEHANVELENMCRWLHQLRLNSIKPGTTIQPLTDIIAKESLEPDRDETSESVSHDVGLPDCGEEPKARSVGPPLSTSADSPPELSSSEDGYVVLEDTGNGGQMVFKLVKMPLTASSSNSETSELELPTAEYSIN